MCVAGAARAATGNPSCIGLASARDGDGIHRGGTPEAARGDARPRGRGGGKILIKILRCFVKGAR